jgi:hypothetical protein
LQVGGQTASHRVELVCLEEPRSDIVLLSIGILGLYASFPDSTANENIRPSTFNSLLISAFDTVRLFSVSPVPVVITSAFRFAM